MTDREKAQEEAAARSGTAAEETGPDIDGADDALPVTDDAGEAAPESREGGDDRFAALEAQFVELKDQYLRKAADFENFRKRVNREKQETADFANQSLIQDLLPVIDDLERAIKAAEAVTAAGVPEPKDFHSLAEGIAMTEKRLIAQLENRWGLRRFDSAGEPFDPNRHEAIMMDKSAGVAEPVVAEDFIKGYTLRDRVIRAAKVKVLMPDGTVEQGGQPDAEQQPG